MREIKFRGKCIQSGNWINGFYFHVEDDNPKGTHQIVEHTTHHQHNVRKVVHVVDPETVGQYTGLKDANGVEIYEGDRLRCTDEERDLEWTTVVRYQDTAFVIDIENEEYNVTSIGFVNFDYTKIEVIGNIHTNE